MSETHVYRRFAGRLIASLAVLASTLVGCGGFKVREPGLKPKSHAENDLKVTRTQMRLRLRGQVDPMCGQIEAAADSIMAGSTEPGVRRHALAWKMEGVPALREALFDPDPMTALADTWVLLCQMGDYFEKGAGRGGLGTQAGEAATVCRRMEADYGRLIASFTGSGDVSGLQGLSRDWATQHPIKNSIAHREPFPGDTFGRELNASLSVGEAADEMTERLDDLSRKVEVYSDQLPRQARWEAEQFTVDLTSALPFERAFTLSERAVGAAEGVARAGAALAPAVELAVRQAPAILATERVAIIEALHGDLTSSYAFVRAERIASVEALSAERTMMNKDLRETLASEHAQMTRDVDQLSTKIVDHAMARLERLVLTTLIALAVGAVLFLVAARVLFGRPGQARAA